MDAKLDRIVDEFKLRLDELVPGGCREKSLAVTNLETAQLFAEKAREVVGDDPAVLHLYGNPREVGWSGWVERKGGVESWIDLDGKFHPHDAFDGALPHAREEG